MHDCISGIISNAFKEVTVAHQELCQARLAGADQSLLHGIVGALWLMLKLLVYSSK